MKIKNVIGKKYGKLTILDDIKNKDKRQRILICICDCGNKCTVSKEKVLRGHTKSCGCLQKETRKQWGVSNKKEYGEENFIGGVKMDNNTIMLIVGFIGSMIPIFTVIVKLNSTITKLNLTIQVLNKQMENSQKDRTEIHTQLNNHETRISILENERRER